MASPPHKRLRLEADVNSVADNVSTVLSADHAVAGREFGGEIVAEAPIEGGVVEGHGEAGGGMVAGNGFGGHVIGGLDINTAAVATTGMHPHEIPGGGQMDHHHHHHGGDLGHQLTGTHAVVAPMQRDIGTNRHAIPLTLDTHQQQQQQQRHEDQQRPDEPQAAVATAMAMLLEPRLDSFIHSPVAAVAPPPPGSLGGDDSVGIVGNSNRDADREVGNLDNSGQTLGVIEAGQPVGQLDGPGIVGEGVCDGMGAAIGDGDVGSSRGNTDGQSKGDDVGGGGGAAKVTAGSDYQIL